MDNQEIGKSKVSARGQKRAKDRNAAENCGCPLGRVEDEKVRDL